MRWKLSLKYCHCHCQCLIGKEADTNNNNHNNNYCRLNKKSRPKKCLCWRQRKFIIYSTSTAILSLICLTYLLIIFHISTSNNNNFQNFKSALQNLPSNQSSSKLEGLVLPEEEKTEFFATPKLIPLKKHQKNNETQLQKNPPQQQEMEQHVKIEEERMACHVPHLDPFDPSILDHVWTPRKIKCGKKFPLLFKPDLVKVNQSSFGQPILIRVGNPKKFGYVHCCHLSFRHNKANKKLSCIPITKNLTNLHPATEHVKIQCTKATTNGTIIVDILVFVPFKPMVKERIERIVNWSSSSLEKVKKVNVVMLGLDSISYLNFLRTMPQTEEFLTKNLSAFKMIGYSKVGDNTFPNLVPVLLGKSVLELPSLCWNTSLQFDSCQFIWKNFGSQGYLTFYGEDNPWISMFRYGKRGFKKSPTDYDLSQMTKIMDKNFGHKRLELHNCYGPRLSFEVLLDYLKMTATAVPMNFGGDQKYFQFLWENSLTHEELNYPKLGDGILLKFLKWFKEQGHLDQSTVFILMSDHGMRFDGIRTTFQGKIEESMPFLYFVMPDWFKLKYGRAVQNMKMNENRLTTPFDLNKTLRDFLVLENIEEDRLKRRELQLLKSDQNIHDQSKLPRGISLFLPIPSSRTCEDAEITDNWCVCGDLETIQFPANYSLVIQAATRVVNFVNEMLQPYPQCSFLILDKILNAQIWRSDDKTVDHFEQIEKGNFTNVEQVEIKLSVALSVSPSDATFETTISRQRGSRGVNGIWTIGGEISRINKYGMQSYCVDDYRLKKFCFCP